MIDFGCERLVSIVAPWFRRETDDRKPFPRFGIRSITCLALLPAVLSFCGPLLAQEHGPADDVSAGRPVRVGIYENKPKVYLDDSGRPAGIFVGILEQIAREEGWSIAYVPGDWSDGLEALRYGRIDLMPDVAYSPERDLLLDFHEEEVLASWSQLYANRKSPFQALSDMNGRRIAVLGGSIQQSVLKQTAQGFGYDVQFIEASSYEEAFAMAADGQRADAVVANHLYGEGFYRKYGLTRTSVIFNPVSLYFATAEGANPDLLSAIDENLRDMKARPGSAYYSELAKWMERPPRVVVPGYLIRIIVGIAAFLLLALAAVFLLRSQVKLRTKHLTLANETLRESEEKFRGIFQDHSAVKLIIDPENGAILEANPAAERFYGLPVEELRHRRIQEIETGADLDDPDGEQTRRNTRHRLADGSIRDVELFCSRIGLRGKQVLHAIVHDITEHRKLEERYRQAQKLESIGRLAAGVAHDYNNMLGVILGYSEIALEKLEPGDLVAPDLDEILKAARKSSDITRQLLAFASKQAVHPKVLDVNESIGGMLKMLRRLIDENIALDWQPGKQLWRVLLDPSQLDQILVNLCVNARDAIGGPGRIRIRTRNGAPEEACDAIPAGDHVVLTVEDDGCGMDPETLGNVFEPFYTTKKGGEGTGLGLATVYGIVRQNGGSIDVRSEPGKGSTFVIRLPRHEGETEKAAGEKREDVPTGQGEKVLLVEDEPAFRRTCRTMLEILGYDVLDAGSPDEALDLAEKHGGDIHLLITDMVMPGTSGRTLADRLRAAHPRMKILFLSGHTVDVIDSEDVDGEEAAFLQKPFSLDELGAMVRRVLNR